MPAIRPAPALDLPLSTVVANVAFDVDALARRLSREVPPRVASARDIDAGIAGRLSYDIDRTPFTVSLAGDRVQVETQLTAHAELCKPLGILGCVPYTGCNPAAHAVAAVPLILRDDYSIGPASAFIAVTRPCLLTSLSLDATPRIQSGADQQARRIRARINAMLPSFEPGARALWNAMGVVVPLGLQSRLRIEPEQVVQGQPTMSDHHVSIPLGVRGRLLIESRESASGPRPALPHPVLEPGLAAGVSLDVPVEVDSESASASVFRTMPSHPIDTDDDELALAALRVRTDERGVVLIASLAGRVCGDVAFLARPVFDLRESRIRFEYVQPMERSAAGHARRLQAVAAAIQRYASVELPVDVQSVPEGLERAVSLVRQSSGPDVIVHTEPAKVAEVKATPGGIAVIVQVRGTADVVVR